MSNWDKYFYEVCNVVASQSKCLSRKIGAILVRDNIIIATGFNGPPRKVSHCGSDAFPCCPRDIGGYGSGEGLHLCPAVHAEANCIASAARNGTSTKGTKLYLNAEVPCKNCLGLIINAGISSIICTEITFYDELAERILKESGLKMEIRIFDLL